MKKRVGDCWTHFEENTYVEYIWDNIRKNILRKTAEENLGKNEFHTKGNI